MIYESKDGIRDKNKDNKGHEKKDQRTVTYYGTLTVSGSGEMKIPCRGRPLEVEVSFSDPVPPKPGCGPDVDDMVEIEIDHLIKPFPLWAIKISWEVHGSNIREIAWSATVLLH
jgi:hypothetical protein